jgi:serine protease DegS
MRKLIYGLLIPTIIGVIGALVLLKQFPSLLYPTVTLIEANSEPTKTSGPASYADAVSKAAPAVVNIYTTTVIKQAVRPSLNNPLLRQNTTPTKESSQTSLGSGVIVSPDGHLLTNYHVIANATEIVVALRDGRESKARVVGIDPDTDLAVLKIDLPNLPTFTLAASDNARVGDVVLAIGNPFGVGQTVTMGIISATGRHELGLNTYEDFIQTDAAINPGNSGGALVDTYGNLVGISTAIFSESGGSQGIGFAIPSKLASSVLQEIIIHGSVTRGWLGLSVISVSQKQLANKGVNLDQGGLLITETVPKGPAELVGLQRGDLMLMVNGESTENGHAIMNLIAQTAPGSKVALSIFRNHKIQEVDAVVAKKPLTTTP